MVAFGLEIKNKDAIPAIMEVRKKLLVDSLIENPFYGKITAHGKDFFTVVLDPVYPRVYLFSVFPGLIAFLGFGRWWGTLSLVIFSLMLFTRVFWSDWLYFLLFKYKTKGGVRFVNAHDSLRRVV